MESELTYIMIAVWTVIQQPYVDNILHI